MKLEIRDNHWGFSLELSAETVADAALLVRMGMNSGKVVKECSTYAGGSSVSTSVTISKKRNHSGVVPKR